MTAPVKNLVRLLTDPETVSIRAAGDGGTGRTLFGHFAVFNRWTEINSWIEGRFRERIAPSAFDETFASDAARIRVLYEHGRDPFVGNKPLGTPDVLRSDKKGAYYEVGLFDTGYVRELEPAIAAGQLGASFRFEVLDETWTQPDKPSRDNPEKLPERTIVRARVHEFGPVTFPAYADATAGLRSITDDYATALHGDPAFVARLTERMGATVVEQLLATLPAPDRATQAATPTATPDRQTEGSTDRTGMDPAALRLTIEAARLRNPRKD